MIYPEYFDRNLTRAEGRRVPFRNSRRKVTIEFIGEILEGLGYEFVYEKDKNHPRDWFKRRGRIWIEVGEGIQKSEIVRQVGTAISGTGGRRTD